MEYSDYISLRNPAYVSHSAGRYAQKRFRKANCPIIERLTNSLMMHGRNNGKKLKAVRIVAHAFEIVRFLPLSCAQGHSHVDKDKGLFFFC
jgi:small subunit ribosomal protein S5e